MQYYKFYTFINDINPSMDITLLLYCFVNGNQTVQFHQMNCPHRLEIYLVNLNTKCELQEMQPCLPPCKKPVRIIGFVVLL